LAIEVIDIRRFEARDFEGLLEAESRAWETRLHWDYTASAQLIASCLAEKRLAGYAMVNHSRIQGYSFFICEGEKGLIGDLFVEPNGDICEHAILLLRHVLETVMATPGVLRVEAQLPHFSLEDLEACFAEHGFSTYQRKFMALPLVQPGWQTGTRVAGITPAIAHLRGCGEYLPQASRVALHRATRKLAAILALTRVRSGTAHIPQVAVAPEWQGQGLGTRLMESSFEELRRQGYHEISLTVTGLNGAAERLYERMGFQTFQTFGAYVWQG